MSEFFYSLTIDGSSLNDIEKTVCDLEESGIIPHILMADTSVYKTGNGYSIDLSTDGVCPSGTIGCWPAKEHEKVFYDLSKQNPSVVFTLSGDDLDDPNNRVFKKAFQNGFFKEAYQEKQDISALLEQASWRRYGSPASELDPDVELNSTELDSQGNAVQETLFTVKSSWLQNYFGVDNHTQLEALLTNSEDWDPTEILNVARNEPEVSGLSIGAVTDLSPEGKKAEIFALFESISASRSKDYFQIAADMAYLQEYIALDNPLSDDELYTLASKLSEASGTVFGEPLLHEEYLDSIRYLLEHGINDNHSPEFPELNPDDTRKLLLTADNQTFGTLVEVVAIDNQEVYNVLQNTNYQKDIESIFPAILAAKSGKPSLSEKIAAAEEKASHSSSENDLTHAR